MRHASVDVGNRYCDGVRLSAQLDAQISGSGDRKVTAKYHYFTFGRGHKRLRLISAPPNQVSEWSRFDNCH